jgi:tellurite resistance protein
LLHQELCNYSEWQRTQYMMVLAHMAGVDDNLASEEVLLLREMCKRFVLGPEARGHVFAATTMDAHQLEGVLEDLKATDLKHSLLLDVCSIAEADGVVKDEEVRAVESIAQYLQIPQPQVQAIELFANAVQAARSAKLPLDLAAELEALEAAGVARASLAMAFTLTEC